MSHGVNAPVPPRDLREMVAGNDDESWFLESGRQSVDDLKRALASCGRTLSSFEKVLDFGCGCGRMARWLLDEPEIELTGIDIEPRMIAWCSEHLSKDRFEVNGWLPPTRFAPDTFDLVASHSVFTHVDERYQDAWLAELSRITRPNGLLVLSFSGAMPFKNLLDNTDSSMNAHTMAEWKAEIESKGILFLTGDTPMGFPDFYHSTFHAPWYVIEHWQRWFELLAWIPRNNLGFQDVVVMRRPVEGEPSPPVIASAG